MYQNVRVSRSLKMNLWVHTCTHRYIRTSHVTFCFSLHKIPSADSLLLRFICSPPPPPRPWPWPSVGRTNPFDDDISTAYVRGSRCNLFARHDTKKEATKFLKLVKWTTVNEDMFFADDKNKCYGNQTSNKVNCNANRNRRMLLFSTSASSLALTSSSAAKALHRNSDVPPSPPLVSV